MFQTLQVICMLVSFGILSKQFVKVVFINLYVGMPLNYSIFLGSGFVAKVSFQLWKSLLVLTDKFGLEIFLLRSLSL